MEAKDTPDKFSDKIKNMLLNTKKGNSCYKMAKKYMTEPCSIGQKVELVSDKVEFPSRMWKINFIFFLLLTIKCERAKLNKNRT